MRTKLPPKVSPLSVPSHGALARIAKALFICLALPCAAAPLLLAQSAGGGSSTRADIKGYVRDKETDEALPHASVSLKGTRQGAATNSDGYFIIVNAPLGKQTLLVTYIGYAPQEVEVEVKPGGAKPLAISLKHTVYEMTGITVEGQVQTVEAGERVSEVVLSPSELLSLPNIGEVDVFRSLQLMPGISGVGDGSSGLYVRGGTPDQNLVLFDGMTIYHVDHFFGMFSAFNADAIKDIRVYKGGYPAEFGGRISSVVDLTGKTGDANERRFGMGVNLLSANGVYEMPLGRNANLLVSARRSYTDMVKSGLYNKLFDFMTAGQSTTSIVSQSGRSGGGPGGGMFGGRGDRSFAAVNESPDFYFYDLNTKLTWAPTPKDLLSLSLYRGKDNLDQSQELGGSSFRFRSSDESSFVSDQAVSRSTNELTTWGNTGASAKWSRRIQDRLYSSLMLSYSSYFSTYDRGTSFSSTSGSTVDSTSFFRGGASASSEDNRVDDLTLRFDNEFHASQAHTLKGGLGLSFFNSHYWADASDTLRLVSRQTDSRQVNMYVQDLWKVLPSVELTGGLRGVYYDRTSKFYLEPRASLEYALSQRVKLKGAWGRYNQFVNRITNENVLEGSRDFWILADSSVAPNFAEHYIAGASWENDHFLVDMEGYYKDLKHLTEYTRRAVQVQRVQPGQGGDGGIGGQLEDQLVSRGFYQGNGYSKGVDILLQKKTGRLTGWLGYTLARVEYTFPELNNGQPFPATHDRRHEVNLVAKYNLGPWDLSATWVFATGSAYTAPVSQYFVTLLDGTQYSYIHVSDKNACRLPDYHRLDLGASRTFYSSSLKWVAGVSVFNLYNHKNVWYRKYDLDTQPVAVTDVTMLGFTPTVFVQIYSR